METYPLKGEGESTLKNETEEAVGATGVAIEPASPRQGAEAKGERGAPMETLKKRKKFSFKKPSKLSSLSSREIGRRVGVIRLPPHPQRQSRSRGRWFPAAMKALPRKGRPLPLLRARSTRPKGRGQRYLQGRSTEEAGPQAAEPSTPSGPVGGSTPASEQNEYRGEGRWVISAETWSL